MSFRCLLGVLACLAAGAAHAEVSANSLFTDHAVLQRDQRVAVWGTARDGERVTLEFAGQRQSTLAIGGRWQINLAPMAADATPQVMRIRGDNEISFNDILIGEVWIASGQSNMERELGPHPGQQLIDNWQAEAAAAAFPTIRQFNVPKRIATHAIADVQGNWVVCSPQTAHSFSAVGFFFARRIHQTLGVPIGIIYSTWGGTISEAWTSVEALQKIPALREPLTLVSLLDQDPAAAMARYRNDTAAWYAQNDPGSTFPGYQQTEVSRGAWQVADSAGPLDGMGLGRFYGVVWLRKEFQLPADWGGQAAILHLGEIDEYDTTWLNGELLGITEDRHKSRAYEVAASVLKPGRNVIAMRILNAGNRGGFRSDPGVLQLTGQGEATVPIALDRDWQLKATAAWKDTPPFLYRTDPQSPNQPAVLWHGMIEPLLPFAIRGITWYQGEQNNVRPRLYRELFPLMIADWRARWHEPALPFLFVQIAPNNQIVPELREAQLLTLQKTRNAAMAVLTDVGNAEDIHPTHKQPVGQRLALAAEALAYGKGNEYSGPLYRTATFRPGEAVLHFTHVGGGLVAQGGTLRGFTLAGKDKIFVAANARIDGTLVVVTSAQVPYPTAVRYGWANVPDTNLFNAAGLPASPFRTDVD